MPSLEPTHPEVLMTRRQVLDRVGLKRTWLKSAVKMGIFPEPVRISNRVLWVEREVSEWIDARLNERDTEVPRSARK